MNSRRTFFKKLFGTVVATVVAPLLPKVVEPAVPDFSKIMIPMIRRMSPEFLIHEIVSVQPMSGPVGLAFAMNIVHGKYDNEDFIKI